MYTPQTSRHFSKYVDPQSGIVSYILTTRAAPIQQAFYFCNSGFSDDGRWLWFTCAYPPSPAKQFAVLDFLTDEIRVYPEVAGGGAYVDPRTGEIWWGQQDGFYRRGPHPDAVPELMFATPHEIRAARPGSMGTHITFTDDYQEFFTDIQTREGSWLCSFRPFDQTWRAWYKTQPGIPYNHAQICPGNPNLGLCAHEGGSNERGEFVPPPMADGVYPRLQVIARGGRRTMLTPVRNYATHEYWSRDGRCVYYCGQNVICRDRLDGRPGEIVVEAPLAPEPEDGNGTWHSFVSENDKYFVFDGSYWDQGMRCWRGCPSIARFYNSETKKIVNMITRNPTVNGWYPDRPCPYHIDPHPRFVLRDTLVTMTTTVRGYVDLAVVPVDQLLEATR